MDGFVHFLQHFTILVVFLLKSGLNETSENKSLLSLFFYFHFYRQQQTLASYLFSYVVENKR